MIPPIDSSKAEAPRAWAGLRWRIAAAAGLGLVSVLTTIRFASASFEEAGSPVADASVQDGIFSGTVRMMGNHVALYSGTSLESIGKDIAVNFSRGGSLVLCPHSQLQILKAGENTGMLLAFQSGGSAEPFPLRTGDEIITPDWRIDFNNDVRKGDIGTVQIAMSSHGDLCLNGNAQSDAYFKVSQMVGDTSFQLVGQKSARFSDGKMVDAPGSCACANAPSALPNAGTQVASNAAPLTPEPSAATLGSDSSHPLAMAAASLTSSPGELAEAAPSLSATKRASTRTRQRPQDVAGYVRSFVHLIFGR